MEAFTAVRTTMKFFVYVLLQVFMHLVCTQDIQFLSQPFTITQSAGSVVTIPGCEFTNTSNIDNITASWLRNGSVVESASTSATEINNTYTFKPLLIVFSSFSDEGFYQCGFNYTDNQFFLSAEFRLVIKEIPVQFIKNPTSIKGKERSTVALFGCAYTSPVNLNRYTYWLVNGQEKIQTVLWSGFSSPYYFPYLQIYKDGYHQCGVFDPLRMRKPVLSDTASVIYFQTHIGNPRLVVTPEYASDSLEIEGCSFNFTSGLRAHAFWHKDGAVVSTASYYRVDDDNYKMRNLSISKTNLNDAGQYQCAVYDELWMTNPLMSDNVTVVLKPVTALVTRHPFIQRSSGKTHVTGCSFNTSRNIIDAAYWLINGTKRINAEVNGSLGKYTLKPLPIDSYTLIGWYQCRIYDASVMVTEVVSSNTTLIAFQAPKILEDPKLMISEDFIIIKGLKFFSLIPPLPEDVYWEKDGDQKLPALIIYSNEESTFVISNINESRSNYNTQGWYEFKMHIAGQQEDLKSDVFQIQLEDVSHTRITMVIDQPYLEAIANASATKANIESEITSILLAERTNVNRIIRVTDLRPYDDKLMVTCRLLSTKMSQSERLNYCGSFPSVFNLRRLRNLNVTSVEIKSLDCCLPTGDGIHDMTLVLRNVTFQCKNDTKSTLYSTCLPDLINGPRWSNLDLQDCSGISKTTEELLKLEEVTICTTNSTGNCSTVEEVSKNLSTIITSPGFNLTKWQDLTYIDTIITNIVTFVESLNLTSSTEVFSDIINVVDVLIDESIDLVLTAEVNNQTSTSLLKNLEIFADVIGNIVNDTNKEIRISRKNIAVSVVRIKRSNVTIKAVNDNGNLTVAIGSNTEISQKELSASIQLPEEVFQKEEDLVYSYYFFKDTLFLSKNATSGSKKLQSVILSASVGDSKIRNLTEPIMMSFRKVNLNLTIGTHTCQFWDFNKQPPGWSSDGCWTSNAGQDVRDVMCFCNHLTNFALLFDVGQSGNNSKELQIITWIGCGVSLAGLLLTTLVYIFFRNLHKKLAPKILICLCFSLMGLLIVFLAGVDQTSPRIGCQVVAALLQYFLLTTFCWMSVEAINLHRCFIKVFVGGEKRAFMYKASLYAWGLPVIFVAVTAGVEPDNLGNDTVCIVQGNSFYFGVMIPVGIILLVNVIILIMVMRKLSTTSMNQRKPGKEDSALLGQVKVALLCSLIVGVTWIFGFLAIDSATMFFQWLFCIFNSFQGFYIFLFYMVRNREVRKELNRLFHPSLYHGSSYTSTMKTLRRGVTRQVTHSSNMVNKRNSSAK